MILIQSPIELQSRLGNETKSIGFVPTMGGLHEGHFSLINKACEQNDICVVSIFLNPTQFNDPKDLATYPSSFDEDRKALEELGVDILFAPRNSDIYPDDYNYSIQENNLSPLLCGKDRPGHFNGVMTVVMKLFNIVQPTRAYFGEKDYQQLLLIKNMVAAFFLPIEIVSCPIVRDEFGLALSSRNRKLSAQGIKKARAFAQSLRQTAEISNLEKELRNKNIAIDYLNEINHRRFAAVKIEDVRLIDNVEI